MSGAAASRLRRDAGPIGLAVLLHLVIGGLLILGSGVGSSRPQDMPGRGQEHEPIKATVVSEADYQAAEKSIADAQHAREEQVRKLRAQAAAAENSRKQTEQELAALRKQKESAASAAQQQQQQVSELSSQAEQAQQSLAKLKQQVADTQKQRAEEEARLKKAREQAEQAKKEADAAAAKRAKEEAAAKKAADEAAAQRKAQMQAQLDAEQQQRDSRALGNWTAAITARVTQNWNKPPSTPDGLDCFIKITQLPSGQVVNAEMQKCNGDQAVQQSITTAIYKASPLPTPEDPSVFQRVIVFEFVPQQNS